MLNRHGGHQPMFLCQLWSPTVQTLRERRTRSLRKLIVMAQRELLLTGGSPWGMRLSGGKDFGSPLAVSKTTPGSKSSCAGVKDGDFILSINGQDTKDMKHMDAQNIIKRTGDTLKLTVTQTRPKWAGVELTGTVTATSSLAPAQPTVATYYSGPPSTTPTRPAQQTYTRSPQTTSPATYKPSPPVGGEPKSVSNTESVDTGLEHGGTSQSPSYMRIMMGDEVPFGHTSVAKGIQKRTPTQPPAPPPQTTPPTHQFKNIRIEDTTTVKTSEKPTGYGSGIKPSPPVGGKSPSGPTPVSPKSIDTSNLPKPSKPPASTAPPPATPPSRSGQESTDVSTSPAAKISSRQTECERCHQPIRGPYVGALGKFWHPEHFTCAKCKKQLSNQTFIMEGDEAYCEPCYNKSVAPICENCRQPITGAYVTAINRFWHQEHFLCFKCKRRIQTDEGFSFDDNHVYCTSCYTDMSGVRCAGCNQTVGANELWVEALEKNWHPHCFVCESCKAPLEGGTFFVKLGRPYCSRHR